ncbi:MAG: epoxyqueuosine reductase [Clostridia bacterium]|nr:epoxyqueuosine reductase [Clostridia bacterium]
MQTTIESFLLSHGAGQVGFCQLQEDNPFHLPYAISYTIPLSDAIVDGITDAPTHTYFHHYRSINAYIDQLSLRVGRMLADKGFLYVPIPASQSVGGTKGIFSHKYAATLSGLGAVGKSGLFLSTLHGPRVRLGTILTDCPFAVAEHPATCPCGDCRLCAEHCPAMAISGKAWEAGDEREIIIDAEACSQYMKRHFQHIGRGSVCGICMQVCPKGKK